MTTRKELILNRLEKTVLNFIHFDRKDDEELPPGEIQEALEEGEITEDEIKNKFFEFIKVYE